MHLEEAVDGLDCVRLREVPELDPEQVGRRGGHGEREELVVARVRADRLEKLSERQHLLPPPVRTEDEERRRARRNAQVLRVCWIPNGRDDEDAAVLGDCENVVARLVESGAEDGAGEVDAGVPERRIGQLAEVEHDLGIGAFALERGEADKHRPVPLPAFVRRLAERVERLSIRRELEVRIERPAVVAVDLGEREVARELDAARPRAQPRADAEIRRGCGADEQEHEKDDERDPDAERQGGEAPAAPRGRLELREQLAEERLVELAARLDRPLDACQDLLHGVRHRFPPRRGA